MRIKKKKEIGSMSAQASASSSPPPVASPRRVWGRLHGKCLRYGRERIYELSRAQYELGSAVQDVSFAFNVTGVSRRHLTLVRMDGQACLIDRSTNGTWVNRSRVKKGKPYELKTNDLIHLKVRASWQLACRGVHATHTCRSQSLPALSLPLHTHTHTHRSGRNTTSRRTKWLFASSTCGAMRQCGEPTW